MMTSVSKLLPACRIKAFCLALAAGFSFLSARGETAGIANDSVATTKTERESIFGNSPSLDKSHFTWGAEFGSSIDLTGHDLSTFDLDVVLGYKNPVIKTAGLGVGIHRTVQGGNIFIPIYALVRTSFTSRPSICFFNAKLGYSFNTIEDSPMFGDLCSSLGCGVNLSQSRKAKTYIIVGAGVRCFNERHKNMVEKLDTHYIWTAQLQFGVNF